MRTTTSLALAGLGAAAYGLYRRYKDRDLKGQTALVTGSSRGLGFLLAREYARQGCRVVICARDRDELDVARRRLRRDGADVLAIRCDVSEKHQVSRMVDETMRQFGGIDILVNNAGIIQVGPVETTTIEDFDDALDSMFYGTLLPTWAVVPQMIQRGGGRIVNITSIGAKLSFPHLLPYNTAKYAALGLSEGLRAELKRHDISVTTVVPGLMRTGSYVHALYKGERPGELAWFALGSSLPGITVNAKRAARRIVKASKKRKAEHIVGIPAKIAAKFAGLFPGLTADLLGLVDRLILPKAEGRRQTPVEGTTVQRGIEGPSRRLLQAGTTLGRRAGRRLNQR